MTDTEVIPEKVAEILREYIEKYGPPEWPIIVKVDGEVVTIDPFSMEETA